MLRLLFQVLLIYIIYKVVKWVLTSNRQQVQAGRRNPEIDEDNIEDAEYREIDE